MDPRLLAAVEASVRWYDDLMDLHGVPVRVERGVWRALAPPPPYHSAVKTVAPEAGVQDVLTAIESHERGSVADSFGRLDLRPHGFDLLIEATWLHHDPPPPAPWPAGWSVVQESAALEEWCARHDYAGVLLDEVLDRPRLTVLARADDGRLTGGAVVHDAGPMAGLSNCWAEGAEPLDWDDVLACVHALHPGRPVTDYAWGDELAAMVAAGFAEVGPQLVWVR